MKNENFIERYINSCGDDKFNDGYNTAAEVCIFPITQRIEKLHNKINNDEFLSNQEQFLLVKMIELKKEIEDNLVK